MSAPSRVTILPRIALTIAAITCAPIHAQLQPWNAIPATSPQSVQLEQSLAVVTQGNAVHAYSAFTKTWSSVTTLFGPPSTTLLNEHLVVRDGPIFHGYSPRTGSFESILVLSAAPVIVSSASPQTWHSILIDGNYLHVFYAFTGRWMTYPFATPPLVTTATNGRFCFLVTEGSNVFGVSSFYGSLVPVPAPLASASGAWGNVGIATSAGTVHGFSASRGAWASMAVAAPPVITNGNAQPAFVAVDDGVSIAMFSGYTGTFTVIPAAHSASISLNRMVAIVVEGTGVHAYSALLGTHAYLGLTATPSITSQQTYALVDDGTSITAYSAAHGAFATPVASAGFTLQSRAQIAVLSPAGSGVPAAVYSSHRNEWLPGPGLSAGTMHLTAVSVVVEEPGGGLWGWSHRGTSWIHQPAPVMETATAGTSPPNLAETFFSRSGNTIYTFNPRTEAWRTATTSAPATLIRAHHAVVIAHDGGAVYGFSIWGDQWSSIALQGTFIGGGGQVQAGWVSDGAAVYGYGGVGQLAMTTEFPDYYRAATLGSQFRLEVSGEAAAPMLLAASLAGASIPVPPFGTLLLDPASLALLAQSTIPWNRIFMLSFQIPVEAALSGLTVHFQAAIAGPSGLYLTNSVFPTIY